MTAPKFALSPSHVVATLLGAAAVLCSALPIGRLFTSTPWLPTALMEVAAVVVIGILLRALGRGPSFVAAMQLAGTVAVLALSFPAPTGRRWGPVPSPATVSHWRSLLEEAAGTVSENTVPAPAGAGVTFVVCVTLGLVAWSVDLVAVGSRMPVAAGLPLLVPFLVAVANTPQALPPTDYILPSVLWAAMLLEEEHEWMTTWYPRAGTSRRLTDLTRRLGSGAALVALAIGLGAVAAGALPFLPQRYLLDGLGRGELAQRHRVGFSPNADMLVDLRSGDLAPVLSYTSTDTTTPPLRVSVATTYHDGRWSADEGEAVPSAHPRLPYPQGLGEGVPRREVVFEVEGTGLAAPHIASPAPVVAGTVVGARWAVNEETSVPVVDAIPKSYRFTYLSVEPTPAQLARTVPPRSGFQSAVTVPQEADSRLLRTTTSQVVRGSKSAYDKATRMQQWLRERGGFTYSLELTPPPAGTDEAVARRSAVDRFLTTKRGYCVQFATTMVLMARSEGIPARMATGFLPGRQVGDRRHVVASDAHAWPELYFEGAGWLRFEPTPSVRSGSLPRHALGADVPGETASPTPTPSAPAQPSEAPAPTPERTDPEAAPQQPASAALRPSWSWTAWMTGVLVLLVAFLPVSGVVSRWHRRRSARTGVDVVETEWLILREYLEDVGVKVPGAATPRQLVGQVTTAAVLDRETAQALERILVEVEQVRYAAAGETAVFSEAERSSLRADARAVARHARASRPVGVRLRALLAPGAARVLFSRRQDHRRVG